MQMLEIDEKQRKSFLDVALNAINDAVMNLAGPASAKQKSGGGGGFGSAVQARLGQGRCDADVVVLLPAGDVRQVCGARPKPIRLQP